MLKNFFYAGIFLAALSFEATAMRSSNANGADSAQNRKAKHLSKKAKMSARTIAKLEKQQQKQAEKIIRNTLKVIAEATKALEAEKHALENEKKALEQALENEKNGVLNAQKLELPVMDAEQQQFAPSFGEKAFGDLSSNEDEEEKANNSVFHKNDDDELNLAPQTTNQPSQVEMSIRKKSLNLQLSQDVQTEDSGTPTFKSSN